MKRNGFVALMATVFILFAFGLKGKNARDEKAAVLSTQKEIAYPEGYPKELTLPEKFTAKDINVGNGKTFGGKSVRTYKSYGLNRMRNQCPSNLLDHYKQIVVKNGWKGKWDLYTGGGSGIFTKGNMEMEVKINDMVFSFIVKIYNE